MTKKSLLNNVALTKGRPEGQHGDNMQQDVETA